MPSGSEPSWRILIALLVYNGEEFVGPCLSSLARLEPGAHSADVLVLDDASPAPGWSDRCREMATDLGFGYYRTPRNLGIPRNMNLGMLRAVDAGYDAVILLNSDTILPSNLIPTLLRPLIEDGSISSTTAWSNNSSVYSIPNSDPDHLADDPESHRLDLRAGRRGVRRAGDTRSRRAWDSAWRIPTANDQRSRAHGPGLRPGLFRRDRLVPAQPYHGLPLCPGSFVFRVPRGKRDHEGRGSVGDGDRMVHAHQAIIDQRYPLYTSQLIALSASSIIDGMRERGLHRIIISAARQHGYRLETSRLHQQPRRRRRGAVSDRPGRSRTGDHGRL